jgi:trimeric autotransporter adhesin
MKKGMLKSAVLAMIFCGMGNGVGLAYTANETNVIVIPTWTSAQTAIESVGGTMKDTGNIYGDWNTVVGFYNHIGDTSYDSDYNEIFGFKNYFMPHDSSGYSQIFGSRNNVASISSTVIGDNNNVAYEKGSPKTDKVYKYNIAIGNSITMNGGSYGIAIGDQAKVSVNYGVAIGYLAEANGKGSTAIGYQAYTDSTQATTSLGNNTWMTTVSFGKNTGKGNTYFARLKNVYEGEDDNDAVNVKQLKNYVANNAGKYDGSDTVTVTAPTTTGAASTIAVKNMAMGADATGDGVTSGATAGGTAAIALGQTANAGGDKSLAFGYGAAVAAGDSVAIGNGAGVESAASSSVALGAGSIADKANTISVGSSSLQRKIVNVAAGEANTDAATYGQIIKNKQYTFDSDGVATIETNESTDSNKKVAFTLKLSSNGEVKNGDTGLISGKKVYDEVRPTDGTYVKKDNTTATNLSALDGQVKTNTDAISALTTTVTTKDKELEDKIGTLDASVSYNVIKAGNNVSENLAALDSAITSTVTENVQHLKDITRSDGASAEGTDSLALGKDSKADGENAISFGTGSTVTGESSVAVGTGHTVHGNNSGAFGDPDNIHGDNSYSFGNHNVIGDCEVGDGAIGNNTFVVGNHNTVTGDNTFVVGNNVTTSANNSVVLGNNSTATEDNVVSVGSKGSERKITNVAKGVKDTDAVNVGQLKDAMQGNMSDLEQKINKVGAGAAALAALHPEGFDPNDKMSFAIGYGHYKNANAGAFGAFYKPNQDTTVSAGSTFGNGNPMVNMGVSFKIGTRTKGAGIYSSNAELVREMNSLKASDTDQAARIAALERENAEMKAQNAEIKAQLAQVMKVLEMSGTVQKRAVSD